MIDRLDWSEKAMRLLAAHYFADFIALQFNDEDVALYAASTTGVGTCIGQGLTLGDAVERAVAKLSDEEIINAGGL